VLALARRKLVTSFQVGDTVRMAMTMGITFEIIWKVLSIETSSTDTQDITPKFISEEQ
jgi:hypothetical protein